MGLDEEHGEMLWSDHQRGLSSIVGKGFQLFLPIGTNISPSPSFSWSFPELKLGTSFESSPFNVQIAFTHSYPPIPDLEADH